MNSLADRVRGLLLVGFDGIEASRSTSQFLADAAGAILYSRNLANAAQVKGLVQALQIDARNAGRPPLLIGIDQEGGPVRRLGALGTPWPSAMALGAVGDVALTRTVYRAIGAEVAEFGVNFDFAPVADINSNPRNPVIGLRSFGDDPAAVSAHVQAAVLGLHDAGVVSSAKHFPGHGDTSQDSHEALPSVAFDRDQLRAREFVPFRAAIEAGVDAVMTAHVAVPALTGDRSPATLSRAVLEDCLRGELGFEGVICTDDMEMRAIAEMGAPGEAAVRAMQAGADVLIFSSSLESAMAAERALATALRDGVLDSARIEASLQRIEKLRKKNVAVEFIRPSNAPGNRESNLALAKDVVRRSIVLVRSAAGMPPLALPPGSRIFIVNFNVQAERSPGHKPETARVTSALGKALATAGYRVTEQLRTLDPEGHEYKQLLMAAGSADAVVALTRRAFVHPMQARSVSDLAMFGKPVIAVSALEPYDASVLPDNVPVIASFGDDELALEAAAQVLLGREKATAKLPVKVEEPETVGFTRSSDSPA